MMWASRDSLTAHGHDEKGGKSNKKNKSPKTESIKKQKPSYFFSFASPLAFPNASENEDKGEGNKQNCNPILSHTGVYANNQPFRSHFSIAMTMMKRRGKGNNGKALFSNVFHVSVCGHIIAVNVLFFFDSHHVHHTAQFSRLGNNVSGDGQKGGVFGITAEGSLIQTDLDRGVSSNTGGLVAELVLLLLGVPEFVFLVLDELFLFGSDDLEHVLQG